MKRFLIIIFVIISIGGIYFFLENSKVANSPTQPEIVKDIPKVEVGKVKIQTLTKGEQIQIDAEKKYPNATFDNWIYISANDAKLYLIKDRKIIKSYPISIAKNGLGNVMNSNQTPTGLHEIKKMIGKDLPINTIIKGGISTGKIAQVISEPISVNTDLVTTRVMWLSGLESGINKGGKVDSYNRFIYIHGTPEEGLIGSPASHGCIRMYNKDVIELFNLVPLGTKVLIEK